MDKRQGPVLFLLFQVETEVLLNFFSHGYVIEPAPFCAQICSAPSPTESCLNTPQASPFNLYENESLLAPHGPVFYPAPFGRKQLRTS